MKDLNKYHQPILEKQYQKLFQTLDELDCSIAARKENYRGFFSSIFSSLKKILFYELPIEFRIGSSDQIDSEATTASEAEETRSDKIRKTA
ncbi:MAG: hypothetical protein PHQ23_04595 [Candidatus Wallbacteria bacterium]|nr:hypothetical protein [Candidatus Wallbacteria bacterium]